MVLCAKTRQTDRLGVVVKSITVGSLGFNSWANQIECSVANGAPPLRCFSGAVLTRQLAA